jgi:transposase
MFNTTLLRVAQMEADGSSAEEIALEIGVGIAWIQKVMKTDGYLVIQESVREGRAGWKSL